MSNDTLTEVIGQGNYDIFHWGWVVEPDPDYQLSTFTCDKRSYKDAGQIYADLSDSFYCNKAVRHAVRRAGEDHGPGCARRDRQAHGEDGL